MMRILVSHLREVCVFLVLLAAFLVLSTVSIHSTKYQLEITDLPGAKNKDAEKIWKYMVTHNRSSDSPRSKYDGEWIPLESASDDDAFKLFIYSAFCDRRKPFGSSENHPALVRIIGISDDQKTTNATMKCALTFADGKKETSKVIDKGWIGFGMYVEDYKMRLREYVFTCKSMTAKCPKTVEIHVHEERQSWAVKKTPPIAVHTPVDPGPKKFNFGICVQIAYSKLDAVRLIEWVEMQKILGVSKIGIYNHSIAGDSKAASVLRYYDSRGLVELRQSHPFTADSQDGMPLHWTPSINDCIYRNMHRFKKILVIDFDEVIVPRKHGNLSAMLAAVDARQDEPHHPARSYVFTNNYYFLDQPPDGRQISSSVLLTYRRKQYASEGGYSVKSIIDPSSCVRMHNHYCWEVVPGFDEGNYQIEPVPHDLGLNQHYKKCHFDAETCDKLHLNYTMDDSMLRFKKPLMQALKKTYTELSVLMEDEIGKKGF